MLVYFDYVVKSTCMGRFSPDDQRVAVLFTPLWHELTLNYKVN